MNYHLYDDVLRNISNEDIKKFTINVLDACDPILEKIPASTSGKYHPEECCKEGGLVVHVLRACYFANMFINACGFDKNNIKGDIILSSLLLHDIGKKEKYGNYFEYVNHPITGAKMIDPFKGSLPDNIFNIIRGCILNHMGNWTPKSHKKEMSKYNMLELIVYQADYLASQKSLEIK